MKSRPLAWIVPVSKLTLLILIVVSAHGAIRADTNVCSTAVVEESFVLPDGSQHAAGRLTLCFEQNFTPATSIHTVRVNGVPIGFVASRRGGLPAPTKAGYFMLFERWGEEALRLVGFSVPCNGSAESYALNRPRVIVHGSVETLAQERAREPTLVVVPATAT